VQRPLLGSTADIEFDPDKVGVATVEVQRNVGITSRTLLVSTAGCDEESAVDTWTVFSDPTYTMDETVAPPSVTSPPRLTSPEASEHGIEAPLPSYMSDIDEESTSTEAYLHKTIRLPTGSDVSVVHLMRLLLGTTNHGCVADGNVLYYFFRGHEGIEAWRGLFFDRDSENSEKEAVEFGRKLIEHGLVHNYSPKVESLHHCFLVLQPLQEPRLLNTFLMHPFLRNKAPRPNIDAMQVITHLSHAMDELCDELGTLSPRELVSRFHRLEERACILQVVAFPTNPLENVTFALNLFNLIVRHVMLLCHETLLKHGGGPQHWHLKWPKNLEEMEHFLRTVCYYIDGKPCSLAFLRDSLYGHTGRSVPIVRRDKVPLVRRLLCQDVKAASFEGEYFSSPMVQDGDPRVLFSLTWGTLSSPVVSTFYPRSISEGLQVISAHGSRFLWVLHNRTFSQPRLLSIALQNHAKLYCQSHVRVTDAKVILPALLSWHREDFGRDPETVLYKILGFLSPDQLTQLRAIRHSKDFEVVFSDEYVWKPGMYRKPVRRESAIPLQERHNEIEVDAVANAAPAAVVPEPILLNDPVPQGPAGRSINSKTTSSKSVSSLRSIFERLLVQRLARLTRGTSRGDLQPAPYHRGVQDTSIDEEDDMFEGSNIGSHSGMYDDDDDDDVHSFFHSTISGITYGSEFEDLLLGARAKRRLDI
jgi:hypothetical protein